MTKALAYMRCSGKDQVNGDTWDRQESAIMAYCSANQIEIVEWFRDEGVSGKMELENRPGLASCLARLESNGVHLLIVEDAQRLARDSMVSELVIRQFQRAGAKVISASAGVDLTEGDDSNPTAKLIRQILAAVSEWDRCVIVLKLKAARHRKKITIGAGEGRKPYGYMSGGPRKADVPDPKEYPTLRIMREMQLEGCNSEEIASNLNQIAVKPRHGKLWRGSVIRKILSRSRNVTALHQTSR